MSDFLDLWHLLHFVHTICIPPIDKSVAWGGRHFNFLQNQWILSRNHEFSYSCRKRLGVSGGKFRKIIFNRNTLWGGETNSTLRPCMTNMLKRKSTWKVCSIAFSSQTDVCFTMNAFYVGSPSIWSFSTKHMIGRWIGKMTLSQWHGSIICPLWQFPSMIVSTFWKF